MRIRGALTLLTLLLPAFGAGSIQAAPQRVADGTLSVRDGRGMLELSARGALIGRIDRGKITVTDPNPHDARRPVVLGAESRKSRNLKTTIYQGKDMRLRSTGAFVHIRMQGRGINFSAVGRGRGLIQGDPIPAGTGDGIWSLNDEEYQPLPEILTGFQLVGTPQQR